MRRKNDTGKEIKVKSTSLNVPAAELVGCIVEGRDPSVSTPAVEGLYPTRRDEQREWKRRKRQKELAVFDFICPECGMTKTNSRQWNLKREMCLSCSRKS